MREPTSVVGIDFGTTNSCVSFVNARGELGRVAVSTGNEPYDTVLASIVLDPLGDSAVGIEAAAARSKRPGAKFLAYFKDAFSSQQLRERKPVKRLVATKEYDPVLEGNVFRERTEWQVVGGEHSREEIVAGAARILERLLQGAFAAGADRDSSLWLGIPVSFASSARKRLICALHETRDEEGRRIFSGYREILRRVHFVLEPVAVGAAPGDELAIRGTQRVLVFDHGGGTLDLSLLEYEENPDGGAPIPRRELAAGGAADVAGRHMDQAFADLLATDSEVEDALRDRDEHDRREIIEDAKRALSTKTTTRLRTTRLPVHRDAFATAIAPILDRIEHELDRTLEAAGLGRADVDWVLMTGGSSLVPAVQERVASVFPDAAERDQILRYFPDDTAPGGGVESAITDVAQGLALFGQQRTLEQVVLWDVELGRDGTSEFTRLFRRGERYELDEDGRPCLDRIVDAADIERDGACYGIYERHLDRRYLFGVTETPGLPADAKVRVRLRRDSVFPAIYVLDGGGRVLRRVESPTGWPADRELVADLERLPEEQLDDFFAGDAEYLPSLGFRQFRHTPLVRRLRVGDDVEWSRRRSNGRWHHQRGRGTVKEIRAKGSHEPLPEMNDWDVSRYVFRVREHDSMASIILESCNGAIRLSPHPGHQYVV